MSLLTEVFGESVLRMTLDEVKALIKNVPITLREKKSYLLKDYAAIKGLKLTGGDFVDIGG